MTAPSVVGATGSSASIEGAYSATFPTILASTVSGATSINPPGDGNGGVISTSAGSLASFGTGLKSFKVALPSTVDASSGTKRVFCIHASYQNTVSAMTATNGFIIFLFSSSSDYKGWVIYGQNATLYQLLTLGYFARNFYAHYIDPTSPADYSNGSFNPSAITHVEYACNGAANPQISCALNRFWDNPRLINGDSSNPGKWTTIKKSLNSAPYYARDNAGAVASNLGKSQYLFCLPIGIGKGSSGTAYFVESDFSVEFLPRLSKSPSPGVAGICCNDNFMGITIDLPSTGYIKWQNGKFYADAPWHLDCTTGTGAYFSVTSCDFVNAGRISLNSDWNQNGGAFRGGGEIALNGAKLTNVNVSGSPASALSSVLSDTSAILSNCGIQNSGSSGLRIAAAGGYSGISTQILNSAVADVLIDSGVTGSINLSNVTFPSSGSTSPINIKYLGSGSVTVTVNRAGLTTSAPNGGTITLVAPSQSLTITGLELGSVVKVYRVSDNALLAGTDSLAGTTFTYNYSWPGSDVLVDVVVVSLSTKYRRIRNVVLNSAGTSFPVEQLPDNSFFDPP